MSRARFCYFPHNELSSSPFPLSGRGQLVPAPHSPRPQSGSRRFVWGFREEKKDVRQVSSFSCCLQSTPGFCQCSCYPIPSVPFISQEMLVGLGWGNRGQARSDWLCGDVWVLSCFIFSLFNTIFIIVPAIILPLYIFDCSVQSEFE